MNAAKDYYSPQEVADMLGVNILSVYRWIKEGRIHAVRLGQFRIRREDLESVIDALPVRRQPLTLPELNRMRQQLYSIATAEKFIDRVKFSEAEGTITSAQAEELRQAGKQAIMEKLGQSF